MILKKMSHAALCLGASLMSIQSFGAGFQTPTFKVMSYNVENLFDTEKNSPVDYTYLPLQLKRQNPEHNKKCTQVANGKFYIEECQKLDWTEAKLNKKLEGIASVYHTVFAPNVGPDLIFAVEVENQAVLDRLAKKAFPTVPVNAVLIEGDDGRGIDVGVISKYKVLFSTRHKLTDPSNPNKVINPRGILEVWLQVGPYVVAAYSNHWPSQRNPSINRELSAKYLSNLIATRSDLNKSRVMAQKGIFTATGVNRVPDLFVMGGDFNTIDNEAAASAGKDNKKRAYLFELANSTTDDPWSDEAKRGNQRGSGEPFDSLMAGIEDSEKVTRTLRGEQTGTSGGLVGNPERNEIVGPNGQKLAPLNPGTSFYKTYWNSLDKIFYYENKMSDIKALPEAYRIIAAPFLLIPESQSPTGFRPLRYSHQSATGFSDHLPVIMEFSVPRLGVPAANNVNRFFMR